MDYINGLVSAGIAGANGFAIRCRMNAVQRLARGFRVARGPATLSGKRVVTKFTYKALANRTEFQ